MGSDETKRDEIARTCVSCNMSTAGSKIEVGQVNGEDLIFAERRRKTTAGFTIRSTDLFRNGRN